MHDLFFKPVLVPHKVKHILTFLLGSLLIFLFIFPSSFIRTLNFYTFPEKVLSRLKQRIPPLIECASSKVSFIFEDFNNPFLYMDYNADKEFVAASLIKVPILVALLHAVREGKVSMSQQVVIRKKDITGGSGYLKKCRLPVHLTVKELAKLMISRSDNTATNKIIDMLGFSYINYVFQKEGLTHTHLRRKILDFVSRRKGIENYICCSDLEKIFRKIYRGEMFNTEVSEMALSFLRDQKINDRIPKYLPHDVVVAHKTGLERNIVGDCGIVFTSCGDYFLCVLVSGFPSYRWAKDFIAKLSSIIYNTFVNCQMIH